MVNVLKTLSIITVASTISNSWLHEHDSLPYCITNTSLGWLGCRLFNRVGCVKVHVWKYKYLEELRNKILKILMTQIDVSSLSLVKLMVLLIFTNLHVPGARYSRCSMHGLSSVSR